MTERCAECRWWHKSNYHGVGECRRHPPSIAVVLNPQVDMAGRAWPLTREADFCGEFQKKEDA